MIQVRVRECSNECCSDDLNVFSNLAQLLGRNAVLTSDPLSILEQSQDTFKVVCAKAGKYLLGSRTETCLHRCFIQARVLKDGIARDAEAVSQEKMHASSWQRLS